MTASARVLTPAMILWRAVSPKRRVLAVMPAMMAGDGGVGVEGAQGQAVHETQVPFSVLVPLFVPWTESPASSSAARSTDPLKDSVQ